jgi:hypothetical protein
VAEVKTLKIQIEMDNKGAIRGVKNLGKASKQMAKETVANSQKMKQSWSSVVTGLNQGIQSFGTLLTAYGKQEKAQETLAAAMRQAGTFTQDAFEHNLKYAQSLQKMTAFGDEAILGVQKMLTNFGVEGKMMDELTKSTLDLAAAKGMDLKAAADLVAKTVGSSTNALTRYGIEVKGAAGSTARMQMAVENISRIFGGSARAEAETFSGRIQQMRNLIGDLQERIGKKLVPVVMPFISLITKLVSETDDLNKITGDLNRTYDEYKEAVDIAADSTKDLTDEQKVLNEVNLATKKVEFFKTIDSINKGYENQSEKIVDLTKKSQDYLKAVRESEEAVRIAREAGEEDVKVKIEVGLIIKELAKRTLSLAEAEQFVANTKLEGIKASTEAARLTAVESKAVTDLAMAQLRMNDMNLESLIVNEELRKKFKERMDAIKEGTFIIEQVEEKTKEGVETTTEFTEEQLKAREDAWTNYYTFINDKRTLDREKEMEAFKQSQEGLKLLHEQGQIGKAEHHFMLEDLEIQHQERLAEIDIGFKTTQQERDLAAMQFTHTTYENLTAKQKQELGKRMKSEKEGAKQYTQIWNQAMGQAVNMWADGITEMIFANDTYQKSFGELVTEVLIGFTKMIAKALIMKGIMSALGGVGLFFKHGGLVPEFADGGKIAGASHSQGGVNINAEGGEYIVKKKSVTPDTLPILHAINKGISNIALMSMPQKFQDGGMIEGTTNNTNNNQRTANIGTVQISSPDPSKLFEQFVDYSADMGVNIIKRG